MTEDVLSDYAERQYDFAARKLRREASGAGPSLVCGVAMANLESLDSVFSRVHLPYFVMYGTLLGAIRDADLIPFDTDIDIGVDFRNAGKLYGALVLLEREGFEVIRSMQAPNGVVDCVTVMRNDEYVDIGLFRPKKKAFGIYYGYSINWDRKKLFDAYLRKRIGSLSVLVPSGFPQLLRRWYGPNWLVPVRSRPADMSENVGVIFRYFFRWFR